MALPPLSHPRDLTDDQWALIGPFLPTLASRKTAEGAWKENRAGLLRSLLEILAQALHDEGHLDLQEAFIDGFAPAKHGGAAVGKTKRGKGSKIMAVADRHGLPVAV